jgi:hypothetical protein
MPFAEGAGASADGGAGIEAVDEPKAGAAKVENPLCGAEDVDAAGALEKEGAENAVDEKVAA